MKVENMTSNKGNKIANQFEIRINDDFNTVYFQSYDTIIAKKQFIDKHEVVYHDDENHPSKVTHTEKRVFLDKNFWDYSVTTGKYRNIFLNETKKETEKKIANGTYILTNLNKEVE